MDRDVLRHPMHVLSREGTERFQELYQQALDALDRAPDGQGIAAGEWVRPPAFCCVGTAGRTAVSTVRGWDLRCVRNADLQRRRPMGPSMRPAIRQSREGRRSGRR